MPGLNSNFSLLQWGLDLIKIGLDAENWLLPFLPVVRTM